MFLKVEFSYIFYKSCIGFVVLSNYLNTKKKIHLECEIHNTVYHFELFRTTKCIQYNIHDTKSCELPECKTMNLLHCHHQ